MRLATQFLLRSPRPLWDLKGNRNYRLVYGYDEFSSISSAVANADYGGDKKTENLERFSWWKS